MRFIVKTIPKMECKQLRDLRITLFGAGEAGRDYGVAAAMLHELGIGKVRLITNNPEKCTALSERGIEISERVGLPAAVTPENRRYLRTKRERMGHRFDL